MSLALTRNENQSIVFFTPGGEQIEVTAVSISNGHVTLGLDAPDVLVYGVMSCWIMMRIVGVFCQVNERYKIQ